MSKNSAGKRLRESPISPSVDMASKALKMDCLEARLAGQDLIILQEMKKIKASLDAHKEEIEVMKACLDAQKEDIET